MAKKKKTTKATTTTVTKGDTVELHYVGTLDTGEQFDSTYDRGAPVKVEVGNGLLIKGFDKALVGMEIGKKSTVKIGKEEAYGDPRPEAFVQVNKQGFPEDFDYTLGNFVPLTNDTGAQMVGRIHEVDDETVTVDLNHPMAGKTLNFDIEVLSIVSADTTDTTATETEGIEVT